MFSATVSWPVVAGFPKMLREGRERAGFTVDETAWRLGVTRSEYRELEAGKRFPTFQTWNRICRLYGWPQRFKVGADRRAAAWRRSRYVDWPAADRFIAELGPAARHDLLRVLTSSSEVGADVIRQFHERGSEMAELLIFLEEWEWARQAMIDELQGS
jgi:transcriptional regulator with XRE-family HTH domain